MYNIWYWIFRGSERKKWGLWVYTEITKCVYEANTKTPKSEIEKAKKILVDYKKKSDENKEAEIKQ